MVRILCVYFVHGNTDFANTTATVFSQESTSATSTDTTSSVSTATERITVAKPLQNSTSAHQVEKVLLAIGIVAVITLVLTVFAMKTHDTYDFTAMGRFLLVLLVVWFPFSIIAIIWRSNVVNIVYASLGALLFGAYLVFDTQLMLGGNHKYAISPEEYIIATLNLFLDIINISVNILWIIGNANRS